MTETNHTRSRGASLLGLLLQLMAFGGTLALYFLSRSEAVFSLAWFILGGVPIWFTALLVFRQRELAALEALDLDELRREKQAAGGGEALFGEGSLGFRVAETRLRWMQKWLVPGFGLFTAVYLATMAIVLWWRLRGFGLSIGAEAWTAPARIPVTMVILTIIGGLVFMLSRYTSGMGRVAEWQLLRGCGSYMLGNTLLAAVLLGFLGAIIYTEWPTGEQVLAFGTLVVMLVLAAEMLVNFVLDIYRPRTPDTEPRACFDSRLLGLFAEPGGIASSIADAINYQFGFQVSQTWFYQLLQRAFVWLIAAGALSLWLLTCIVIVQPQEHVIVERFGRQLNAERPWGPGPHLKLPWPIEVARAYNTEQLHEIMIGFEDYNAEPDYAEAMKRVMLWTDTKHMGQKHFDFMIAPTDQLADQTSGTSPEPLFDDEESRIDKAAPVHLMRMDVAIQYRICKDRLSLFTQQMQDPHRTLFNIAWEEVGRLMASTTADDVLGEGLGDIGPALRARIDERVSKLGFEVVYVGTMNIHPEKSVAEAYRTIVQAEQEKTGAIREALVIESERLSKVAGNARTARALAQAVEQARLASSRINTAENTLRNVKAAVLADLSAQLSKIEPAFLARVQAQAGLERAREVHRETDRDFNIGLGETVSTRQTARDNVTRAEQKLQAADAELELQLAPLRTSSAQELQPGQFDTLTRLTESRTASAYWNERLASHFTLANLEGEAASVLAKAFTRRWVIETVEDARLVRARNEREAYQAAPNIYKARLVMEALVAGMKDARKFFLAFEPGDRTVRVRFIAEDPPPTDMISARPDME